MTMLRLARAPQQPPPPPKQHIKRKRPAPSRRNAGAPNVASTAQSTDALDQYLGIQGLEPTTLVPETQLSKAEVAQLLQKLEGYDDSKLQASLAAIGQKLGQTIDLEQLVKVARLASQGVLSRADVLRMCAKLMQGENALGVAVVDVDNAFRALAQRIKRLYLALALQRSRQQSEAVLARDSEGANVAARRQRKTAPRRHSAVEELRQELSRSQLAERYFADAINAEAAQVSATIAVNSSELASKVAIQLGFDKLASAMAMIRRGRLLQAFDTWCQISQLHGLEAETERWMRIFAARRLERALRSWRARLLQLAMRQFVSHHQRQEAIEYSAAAIELQRIWRGAKVRLFVQRWTRGQAATKIQCIMRTFLAKRRAQVLRQQDAAAKVLVRYWRGFVSRQKIRFQQLPEGNGNVPSRDLHDVPQLLSPDTHNNSSVYATPEPKEENEPQQPASEEMQSAVIIVTEGHAALRIQSNVRGWLARRRMHGMKIAQLGQRTQREANAAVEIQTLTRGWLERCRYTARRVQRSTAAKRIQRCYRQYTMRQAAAARLLDTAKAAQVIQWAWRKFASSRERAPGHQQHQRHQQPQQLLEATLPVHEHQVVLLQRAVRRYLALKRQPSVTSGDRECVVAKQRTVSRTSDMKYDHGRTKQVILIQSTARMYLARLKMQRMREATQLLAQAGFLRAMLPGRHDTPPPTALLGGGEREGHALSEETTQSVEHEKNVKYVIQIQAAWRGWTGRRRVQIMRRDRRITTAAAVVIGKAVLRYHKQRQRRTQQLVNMWRGVALAYCKLRRQLKHQRIRTVREYLRLEHWNATKHALVQRLRAQAIDRKRRRVNAIKIQRMVRGMLARHQMRDQRNVLIALRHERITTKLNNAATVLQCFVRCVFARLLLRRKQAAAAEAQRQREEQRRLKRTINQLYVEHMRSMYALRIQRLYRGYRGRQIYAELVAEAIEQGRDRAHKNQLRSVQTIQALWRGYLARKLARKLRQQQLLRRRRRARRKKGSN